MQILTVVGLSKATGIRSTCLYCLDAYIAFGDSLNDVGCFKHASISVAMGQGNEAIKADGYIVTSSIDEDGIYKACLHLGLIE